LRFVSLVFSQKPLACVKVVRKLERCRHSILYHV
jgi:hypothetical protein